MITYSTDGVKMPDIKRRETTAWIKKVAASYGRKVGEIGYMFVNDEKILEVNNEYLGHDYYTDIITFDYCEGNIVSGDLFISLDTVLANSTTYRQMFTPEFKCELLRVIIHGILHLSGEDDITAYQQKNMRRAENFCLKMLLSDFDSEKISVNYKA